MIAMVKENSWPEKHPVKLSACRVVSELITDVGPLLARCLTVFEVEKVVLRKFGLRAAQAVLQIL